MKMALPTEEKKVVEPWVIDLTQQGMHMLQPIPKALRNVYFKNFIVNGKEIQIAGKTGTAEYCDNVAQSKNLCQPGNWPTHAWFIGYAPYEDPEIAVVAFVYNGGEGASVAAPIARKIMEAYFELKAIDAGEPEVTTPDNINNTSNAIGFDCNMIEKKFPIKGFREGLAYKLR